MSRVVAALITQNCPAGDISANGGRALDLAREAAEKGAKLLVFPEMNLTGYTTGTDLTDIATPLSPDLALPFKRLASTLDITLVLGLARKSRLGQKTYAAQAVFFPDQSQGIYQKVHTAPFEKPHYTAGNEIPVFESHGIRFGVQLCYDAHFPELSLAMALKNADVIFIPHASPRGTAQEKFDSWMRHLTARAFDNGLYVAACNQTGDNGRGLTFPGLSLFIGPDGKLISRRLDPEPGIHLITLDTDVLEAVRSHRMRYFLPHRRGDLFDLSTLP